MTLVEDGLGGYEVVASKEPMTKTVAFRLPPSEYGTMMTLVETFPERSWGAALRWLISDDQVRSVIAQRITLATRRASAQ